MALAEDGNVSKELMVNRFQSFKGIAVALLVAGLTACGSSNGNDDNYEPPPGGGTPLTPGVPGLVGDWLENGCTAVGAQSFKRLVRAAPLTSTSIAYSQGVVSYPNANCTGPGTQTGPSRLGDVVFSRSESNERVAANWGEFTTITGTRSAVVWGKKSETVLCLLGEQTPSILPTLATVESSLARLSDQGCFTRQ